MALKNAKQCLCTGKDFQVPRKWQNNILLAMENEVKKKRRSFRVPLKLSNAFDKEKLQPFIKLLKPKASSGFPAR